MTASAWGRVRRSLLVLVVAAGGLLFFLQLETSTSHSTPLPFDTVTYGEALVRSAAADKPVMIDFFADWCAPCREMERVTFRDREVAELLSRRFIPVRVDVDSTAAPDGLLSGAELADRFGVASYPTFVITDAEGREIKRFSGFHAPEAYLEELREALDPEPGIGGGGARAGGRAAL